MNFLSKVSGSIDKLSDGVAKLATGLKQSHQDSVPDSVPLQNNPHLNSQSLSLSGPQYVSPAAESRAPFEGPFLKFIDTDLRINVNRYSVLVIVKPGSNEAPYLRLSAGGPISAPTLLDQYAGHRFWRIEFVVPLKPYPQTVNYSINFANDYTFHIPGRDEPYRWFFTSCNGFSSDVVEEEIYTLNNIQPLWTDILRDHSLQPYHAQMGGGDQVYMDNVWLSQSLKAWVENPNKEYKRTAPFSEDMNREVHRFYWDTYLKHFNEEGFRQALAIIPYNFTWDDHDIFDGYGSYPEYLALSPVFQNIFVAAQRFYLLFQQHTNLALARQDGYIGVHGHSAVRQYGPYMAFVTVDVRTERNLSQIVSTQSWNMIYDAIDQLAPTTRHVIWGATIPLVWPRIVGEAAIAYAGTAMNKITSAIDGISTFVADKDDKDGRSALVKLFQKTSIYSNVLNSLGEPELLDDLNDHWTAENHINERSSAISWFQEFSRRRGNCRITFLSGDVHCCGVGKLYSADTNVRNEEEKDHRLMYQVVSSAIGNKSPPAAVITVLHKSSQELEFDQYTKEDMHPVFLEDIQDNPITEQLVMGARNWCRVTVPTSRPESLLFEIMVEKVVGDMKGETKPYGVYVPGLTIQ